MSGSFDDHNEQAPLSRVRATFLSRLSTAPLPWCCITWRSSPKLSSLTWNKLFSIPQCPGTRGERPFGVYVRQAGHRVLLTFHPLATFEVLDPLADLDHIGQTREWLYPASSDDTHTARCSNLPCPLVVNCRSGSRRAFSFSSVIVDAHKCEGFGKVCSVAAQGSGYVAMARPPHQGGCQIAQRCHHLGSGGSPYLRTVFVEGDVAYPMQTVLDVPVLSKDLQQTVRPGNGRGETGHRIAHRHLTSAFHYPPPLQPAHLLQMRPSLSHRPGSTGILVYLLVSQGPQLTPFQPSMTPLGRGIHPHHQRCPSSPPFPRLPRGHCRPVAPLSFQWGKMLPPDPGTKRADSPLPATGSPHHRPQSAGTRPVASTGRPPPLPGPPGEPDPELLWPPPAPDPSQGRLPEPAPPRSQLHRPTPDAPRVSVPRESPAGSCRPGIAPPPALLHYRSATRPRPP